MYDSALAACCGFAAMRKKQDMKTSMFARFFITIIRVVDHSDSLTGWVNE